MKEYKLAKKALNDYRTGAKRDADLDIEILKIKFNCLINASVTVNKKFLKKEYIFGRCVFTVNVFNTITSIKWDHSYPVATKELKTLFSLYKQCGLNQDGNSYLKVNEKKTVNQ